MKYFLIAPLMATVMLAATATTLALVGKMTNYLKPKHHLIVYGLILAILFLVYSPVIHSYYVYHDDYYFWGWQRGICYTHPQFKFFLLVGRPVANVILCPLGALINNLEDANLVRGITLILIGLVALFVYIWLRLHSLPKLNAFLLSLIIISLPPFQVYAGWIIASYIPVSICLSTCSLLVTYKVANQESLTRKKHIAYLLLAASLLFLSLLTYQPGALFSVALMFVPLIKTPAKNFFKLKKLLTYYFLLLFVSASIYVAILRILIAKANSLGIHDARATVNDYLDKASWFVTHPLFDALNLWNIVPSLSIAALVISVIAIGIILEVFATMKSSYETRKKLIIKLGIKYLFILIVIPLSHVFNLLTEHNVDGYRLIAPLATVVLLFLYFSFNQIINFFPTKSTRQRAATVLLASACLFFLLKANENLVNYFAFPNRIEITYLKSELAQRWQGKPQSIHIIRPQDTLLTNVSGYGEFGTPSSVFPQDIPWMVKCALKELNFNFPKDLKISSSSQEETTSSESNSIVIDMTKLKYFKR